MLKTMVFMDGSWLYAGLASALPGRHDSVPDLRQLSAAVVEELGRRNQLGTLVLIRSYCFAACPENCDPSDEEAARRQRAFFGRLRDLAGLELQTFAIDCQRRPLARADAHEQGLGDAAVAVALSVSLMRNALMPATLDVAVMLVGRAAYVPLLREVRRFGRQVAVVGLQGASAPELIGPAAAGVRDFDVLWLDPLLDRLERGRGQARPSRGEDDGFEENAPGPGVELRGRIKNIIRDRGYGFIAAEDGRDYFFHANALKEGLEFDELPPDLSVLFEVKNGPSRGRAGAAGSVRGDPAAVVPDTSDVDAERQPAEDASPHAAPPPQDTPIGR
jgi:cold shock CspA family protein